MQPGAAPRAGAQLSRARPAASPGLGGRPAPCNPRGADQGARLWPGSGGGRPGMPSGPAGGSLGRPGAPAAPCPGRAEPCRLCRRLRGISGAKRSSAADPEAGPQPGQGRPQEEEGEAEARWPEVARPLPPRRDWLCGDRRFRCG